MDETLAAGVELISGCVVHREEKKSNEDCDLAVAVDPDDDILDAVFKSLRDGGSCYIEWTLSPFQNPSFVREKLGKHGFMGTRLYVMRNLGSNGYSGTWIPIDTDTAIEYILSRRAKNKSLSLPKYLTFAAQNLVFRLLPGLLRSYPVLTGSRIENVRICSISQKPDAGTGNNGTVNDISLSHGGYTVNEFQSLIEKTLNTLSNDYSPADRSEKAFLYLFNKDTSTDQVLLYVFNGRKPKPYFFVKVSRSEESTPAVRAEFENLRCIHDRTGGLEGIPKALFSLDFAGQTALGESYVRGTPLDSIIGKDNYPELCGKVCDWITDFGEKTRIPAGEDAWDKLISPSSLGEKAMTLTAHLDENLRRIEGILRGIQLKYLVCEHRDFGPWNIHIDSDGRIGVVDWVDARPNGLPLLDLVYFLANTTFHYDGAWKTGDFGGSYRTLLDPSSFTGRLFHECTSAYADRLGIPLKDVGPLRLLCWLIQATEETVSIDGGFFIHLVKEELEHYTRTE